MGDLIGADGFRLGLAVAALAAIVVLVVGRFAPGWLAPTIPGVAGTLAGFAAEHRWSWAMFLGLGVLALGAELGRFVGSLTMVALVPGAVVLALALPEHLPGWTAPVLGAATIVATGAFVWFDRHAPRLFAPLLTLTTAGVYAAVPDTEFARSLLGATVVGAALGAHRLARARPGAAAMLGGLVCWSVVVGGYARPPTVVGALGCTGLLVIGPALWRKALMLAHDRDGLLWLAAQLVIVGLCSRVATRAAGVPAAAAVSATVWIGAALVMSRVAGSARPRPRE